MAKAIVRATAVNAAKGNARAQKLFLEILRHAAQFKDEQHTSILKAAVSYKEQCRLEFVRCKELGKPLPDYVPHPDHVEIDLDTGDVRITGPISYAARDKANWERVALCRSEIRNIEAVLKDVTNEKLRTGIQEDLDQVRKDLAEAEKIAAEQHRYAQPKKA